MCIIFIWNQKIIWKEHSKVLLPVYSTSLAFFSSSSCTSAINIASWLGSQSNVGWIHLFCFGVRQCCFMNSVLWSLMLSSSEGKTRTPSTASFQNGGIPWSLWMCSEGLLTLCSVTKSALCSESLQHVLNLVYSFILTIACSFKYLICNFIYCLRPAWIWAASGLEGCN